MTKCLICDEPVISGMELCYLHDKYARGLTSPYFETLYDYLYWNKTFNTVWKSLDLPHIKLIFSESVEVQLKNEDTVLKIMAQVERDVGNKMDLVTYLPLVKNIAKKYAATIDYYEMYNVLFEELIKLEHRIPIDTAPKIVSVLVSRRLRGAAINYIYNTAPETTANEVEEVLAEQPDCEELCLLRERDAYGTFVLCEIMEQLNDRAKKVFMNMFSPVPKIQEQLAAEHGVSRQVISTDGQLIMKLAKEISNDRY